MKINIPKFTVEYKDAKFTFKYGTDKDLIDVLDMEKRTQEDGLVLFEQFKYLENRLVSVEGLEVDGEQAEKKHFLQLPREVLIEVLKQWKNATIKLLSGADDKSTKKKRTTKKSKKG